MVLKGEEATAATYAVTSSFVTMTGDRVVYNQSSTSISYKPFTLKRRITESNVIGASPCEKLTCGGLAHAIVNGRRGGR